MTHLLIKALCFLVIYSCITLAQLQGQSFEQPIAVGGWKSYYFKGGDWSVLATKEDVLDIEKITTLYEAEQFQPVDGGVFNGGVAQNYYWFHFKLVNNTNNDFRFFINLQNSRINIADCYEVSRSIPRQIGTGGDFYHFPHRQVETRDFVFDAVVEKGEVKDFYVHINQVGHALFVPLVLTDKNVFTGIVAYDYLTSGLTYGALLFVSLLCLLFYFSTRYHLYLLYACYIGSTICWFLSYFGLGYEYIWDNYPPLNTIAAPFFACVNIIFNLLICEYLLSLRMKNPGIYTIFRYTCFTLLLIAFLPVILNLHYRSVSINSGYLYVFLIAALSSMSVLTYVILFSMTKNSLVAKVYFAAGFLKLGSIVNLALFELGLTSGFYHMEGVLQVGILVETFLLCLALSKRYSAYKAGAIQRTILAQEAERAFIAKNIHDSLSNDISTITMSLKAISHSISDNEQALEKITGAKKLARKVHNEMRIICHNLVPSYLSQSSLYDAITNHIAEIKEVAASGAEMPTINFSFNEDLRILDDALKVHLFRIVQELLSNSIKHSSASVIEVLFDVSKQRIKLTFQDNGKGLNHKIVAPPAPAGLGIQNIKSRVSIIGGSINFDSNSAEKKSLSRGHSGIFVTIKIPRRNTLKKYAYDF